MKKTYINPETKVHALQVFQMVATSDHMYTNPNNDTENKPTESGGTGSGNGGSGEDARQSGYNNIWDNQW